jgi:hypothetical protein
MPDSCSDHRGTYTVTDGDAVCGAYWNSYTDDNHNHTRTTNVGTNSITFYATYHLAHFHVAECSTIWRLDHRGAYTVTDGDAVCCAYWNSYTDDNHNHTRTTNVGTNSITYTVTDRSVDG